MDDQEGSAQVEPEPVWPEGYATKVLDTAGGDAPEPDPIEDEGGPVASFDPRCREPFEGLLYLGTLTRAFRWGGHDFKIRSLSTDDILKVGLATAPYDGTAAQVKAYQAACIAGAIVSVDGQPLPLPVDITTDPFDERFRYVVKKWWPPVIDVVYQEILNLEFEVDRVLKAMERAEGKAPG